MATLIRVKIDPKGGGITVHCSVDGKGLDLRAPSSIASVAGMLAWTSREMTKTTINKNYERRKI